MKRDLPTPQVKMSAKCQITDEKTKTKTNENDRCYITKSLALNSRP